MKVKGGVIWDMDGVLVDSAPFHYRAWRRLWEERGIYFSEEEFYKTFGMRNDAIIHRILGEEVSEKEIREIGKIKEEYFRQFAKGNIEPKPGVREILEGLKEEGFLHAVATSGPRENLDLILEETGIKHFFTALVCGEEVRRGKPHPEIFLRAAQKLSLPPSRCIVVEDAPAGIEGAKRAGMKCIGVSGTHPSYRLNMADMVIDDFRKVKAEDFCKLLSKS